MARKKRDQCKLPQCFKIQTHQIEMGKFDFYQSESVFSVRSLKTVKARIFFPLKKKNPIAKWQKST